MMQEWFKRAKLGIFIHWGIYAVNSVAESWSFYKGEISYEDYMAQCAGFTAEKYNPKEWAQLFKEAGARYAVLTAKHHDGFALWDTALSDLNAVKKTPAARDLIAPYCDEMRKAGLKVGLYFSHLDWSHPDYPSVFKEDLKPDDIISKYSYPSEKEDLEAWKRFLAFHRGQLKELMTKYGTIDLMWFDGDWERSARQWDMKGLREFLHSLNKDVILNSRMLGYGDYKTPEQGMPILPPDGDWEFCMTINDSWGYRKDDKNYKSLRQIVRTFAECIGMGGNLLLDIGPLADGTIDPEQEKILRGLGKWIKKYQEAIYPTDAGLPLGHFYGASTISADRKTLYLFFFDRPWENIAVKGIKNKIKSVTALGANKDLAYKIIGGAPWVNIPGVLWIDTPEDIIDPLATVIKVELEDELDLYRESGAAIQNN